MTYTLSSNAVKELGRLRQTIKKEILAQLKGGDSLEPSNGRIVRIGKTASVNFAYPATGNTFEVKLGSPDFDNTVVGTTSLSFEPYVPADSNVRVCRTVDGSYIEEDTEVGITLVNNKWYITTLEGSGSSDLVVFEITEANGYLAETAPTEDGGQCTDGTGPMDEIIAEIIHMPCGKTSVPLMDENCKIPLTDPIGWTDDRTPDELIGKRGVAMYVSSDACYVDSYTACQWVIVSIDLFRERLVVVDWIKEKDRIVVKYERHKVWDHCTEPDYILDLLDCTDSNPYGCI